MSEAKNRDLTERSSHNEGTKKYPKRGYVFGYMSELKLGAIFIKVRL